MECNAERKDTSANRTDGRRRAICRQGHAYVRYEWDCRSDKHTGRDGRHAGECPYVPLGETSVFKDFDQVTRNCARQQVVSGGHTSRDVVSSRCTKRGRASDIRVTAATHLTERCIQSCNVHVQYTVARVGSVPIVCLQSHYSLLQVTSMY